MAYFKIKLKSVSLATPTTVRVYLPTDHPNHINQPAKGMITLLHGYTNDGDDWINYSAAVRYAGDNGLALLIPDGYNSFYQNMSNGQRYYTWLTQEMPELLQQTMQLPWEREKHAICGLSMGGYGALMLGLSCPERYFACASFSGAVDLQMMLDAAKQIPEVKSTFSPIFGDSLILPQEYNLFHLTKKIQALPPQQQPQIYCTVGRQDTEPYQIYAQNQSFKHHVEQLNLKFAYQEWEGGHEWNFWDKSLVYAIDRFFNPGYAQKTLQQWAAT